MEIDVVLISWAKNKELEGVTNKAIETLFLSQSQIDFNVFVIESNRKKHFDSYPRTKTIHPAKPFNYNKYLNIGRKLGKAEYVALCNNDLVFEKGWASNILEAFKTDPELLSTSPFCPGHHDQEQYKQSWSYDIYYGYKTRRHLCGWCIFQQRKIYDIIGDLDENFKFWFSDNDYAKTLEKYKIKHALVISSRVQHLSGQTIKLLDPTKKKEYLGGQRKNFDKKWNT